MTHSPTPTELLALRTANAALLESRDSFCDMVATVVFALGSAQLLQSPETAAELARLRAERSPALETEQAALLAELIGDVQPARVPVLLDLGESVRDRRDHDHASQNEDWYCANLTAYMGERMGAVLRRLLNSEAQAARLAARVAELEAERTRPAPLLADAACLSCGEGLDDENISDFCSERCASRRDASVAKLRTLLDGQRQAAPDGPPPHPYRLGRDLPEVPRG